MIATGRRVKLIGFRKGAAVGPMLARCVGLEGEVQEVKPDGTMRVRFWPGWRRGEYDEWWVKVSEVEEVGDAD